MTETHRSERARIREWQTRIADVNDVVVNIQRLYRGYIDRLHVIELKKLQVLGIRQRYKMACIMQRLWRGHL